MPAISKPLIPLALTALLLAILFSLVTVASADLPAQEIPLDPIGEVYELNLGPQGLLWISENSSEQIWSINPLNGDYNIFHDTGQVSDARQSPDGSVWWIDQATASLGQLWPETSSATTWIIPGASTLFGTAVDGDGNVWFSQFFHPQFYRFMPSSSQLCTYSLGSNGGSDYILARGNEIWLGDWINNRVSRLDSTTNQLTSWALPDNSRPEGLALDPHGDFWYADPDLQLIVRLQPALDHLTIYNLPFGSQPNMLSSSGHRIWYSEGEAGSLGRLDPYLATGTAMTVIRTTATLAPTCTALSSQWAGTLQSTTGSASWASASYTNTVDSGGWFIHQLPTDALPWGIAAHDGMLSLVDNGRQVLAQVQDSLSLVACVESDADGDLLTTDDRVPLSGWTVQLFADGIPQDPPQLTASNGCYVWDGLNPTVSYGVGEDLQTGWAPLGPTTHTFGQLVPGQPYIHTFLNTQRLLVSACKLEDADGDLATTNDQTPLPDWPVFLTIDGQRQLPGQFTGQDGCYTWNNLFPLLNYGVEEDLIAGWTALTPTEHDFGEGVPGGIYEHTFINKLEDMEDNIQIYLPSVIRQD